MVKNSIKVYARLKCDKDKKKVNGKYEITRKSCHEDVVFSYNSLSDKLQRYKFRFHKIFDANSCQEDIFDVIAKPVVNSVINGYNGTILAYGQTGSGKTYAITGSPTNYNNRGIIPRSIEQIFAFINSSPDKYFVHISYMEIYNEIGYDLLNPKQPATSLEELPRVVLLEDGKGEAHLRNLSVLPAINEQEAMRLLFLGDTNRTIAETPVNEYSSRSHCIFTIYISSRNTTEAKVRKSKLHLVDLAGSERIHKTNITGVTLKEAKHINLSLHYLERVIYSLSQPKKQSHIPYRNSMMTFLLRDSLSGNSLTAMLTTLSVSSNNIEETLSTCKFAQRVALINTEAVINEEIDPQQEINLLKNEVVELRRRLEVLKDLKISEELSTEEIETCKTLVDDYLNNSKPLPIAPKIRQVQYCFELMRSAYVQEKNKNHPNNVKEVDNEVPITESNQEYICSNVSSDASLSISSEVAYYQGPEIQNHCTETFIPERFKSPSLEILLPSPEDRRAFEKFITLTSNRSEIDSYYQMLDKKYECAKIVANTIEECQKNIITLRQKMEELHGDARNFQEVNDFNCQLMFYQNIYRETILQLQTLKNEIEHLKHGLKQAEIRTVQKFKTTLSVNAKGKQAKEIYDDKIFDILKDLEKENNFAIYKPVFEVPFGKNAPDIKMLKPNISCENIYYKGNENYLEHQNSLNFNPLRTNASDGDINFLKESKGCYNKIPNNFFAPQLAPFSHSGANMYKNCNYPTEKLFQNIHNYAQNLNDDNQSFPITEKHCKFENQSPINAQINPGIINLDQYVPRNRFSPRTVNEEFILRQASSGISENFATNLKSIDSYNVVQKPLVRNSSQGDVMNTTIKILNAQPSKPVKDPQDSQQFLEFMKTIPLTGDPDVDDEIYNFYRTKFNNS